MTTNVVTRLGVRSHDTADEVRRPDKTLVEIVNVGDYSIGRFTFSPGWRWDECIKPVVQTEHCELSHVGFCLGGTLEVETTDGTKVSIKAGDSYTIPPGHNAWVVGEEAFRGVEFLSAAEFAVKPD